jgi:geranylgeranyl diphosphate synthase type II
MTAERRDPLSIFNGFLRKTTGEVDATLRRLMPNTRTIPKVIHRAMNYSVFAGGKRIRPAILILAYRSAGGKGQAAHVAGAAVEILHTFSLIHDDLPCMDDDDYRRGKLSNHKVFGEGVAVLAGDALHSLAFDILGSIRESRGVDPRVTLSVIDEICRAIGTNGMIGGQVMDLALEGQKASPGMVEYIHRRKTAALLKACLRVGGLLARAGSQKMGALSRFGDSFGLAFQIVDDILNVRSSQAALGKKPGGDERLGKVTWPSVHGLEKSDADVTRLLEEASREARHFGAWENHFRGLAQFISERRNLR